MPTAQGQSLRFLHIPKTAGTTFALCLLQLYGPPCFIFSGDLSADLRYFRCLSGKQRRSLRLMSGHAPLITGEPDIDCLPTVTFLRDPIERVKSFCQHVSEGKSPYLLRSFPPKKFVLDAFLDSGIMELDNFQTRVLLGQQSFGADLRDPAHAARRTLCVLRGLAGFGLVESFDVSLMLFRTRLGWRWPVYQRFNQKNAHKALVFTGAHLERIRELNAVDCLVYEEARREFEAIARNGQVQLDRDLRTFRLRQKIAAVIRGLVAVRSRIA
jgi:hypothetical protein